MIYDKIINGIQESFVKRLQLFNIYKNIFINAPDGMFVLKDNKIIDCNQAVVDIFEFQNREEFLHLHPSALCPKIQENGESSFDKVEEHLNFALNKGKHSCEWTCLRKNNETFLAEVTLTNISTRTEKFIIADFRALSAKALLRRQREQEFEVIFNSTQIGLAIIDLESNFLEFNDAHLKFTGYTREELLQKSCISMAVPEDIPKSIGIINRVLKEGFVSHYEKGCINNYNKAVKVVMSLTLLPDKQRILLSVRDVTQERLLEAKLQASQEILYKKAHYDTLTGLPNRSLFKDRLNQSTKVAKRDEQKFALIFIDFDGFKSINDTYGHKIGDAYLKGVSGKIQNNIRDSDTFARIGGDEFVIIMNNIQKNMDAEILVEKIYKSAKEPFLIEDYKIQISLSMGIAIYPQDTASLDLLLSYADMAMYTVKSKNKNSFAFYNENICKQIQHNKMIEAEIQQALLDEHFVVYYQPQINTKTNEIAGVEALVRLNHPEKGLLYPDYFLNVANATGLIFQIDSFVMKHAMQQMKKWKEKNYEISLLSLNFSMKQIEQENSAAMFSKLLEETGCEAKWLELEITEHDMMQNPEQVISNLQYIKSLGISIAIDDFGTGYSSLSYLKRFPINRLKIDKSFIDELHLDEEDSILTKTIISLAKNLNLDLIAEGVEKQAQKEFLLEYDCEQIQGYLYSKPVPAQEVEEKFLK